MGFFNWLFGSKSSDGENKKLLSEANATIDQLKQELEELKKRLEIKD